jgi:hypothetical protein
MVGKVVIFLEVDEMQHSSYQCDLRRMMDIVNAITIDGNTLPVLFIRYNPHAFKVNNVKTKVLKKEREARLVKYVSDVLEGKVETGKQLACQYMFYDTDDSNKLDIWANGDYDRSFREDHCLPPIV